MVEILYRLGLAARPTDSRDGHAKVHRTLGWCVVGAFIWLSVLTVVAFR